MPVKAGEHDRTEDGLVCVTHIRDTYQWRTYDSEANLAIRVNRTDGSLSTAAHRAVEQSLASTPLGRAIGRDAMRPVAEAILATFGLSWDHEYENGGERFTLDTEKDTAVKKALIDLLTWAPEYGYPDELGTIGAERDRVGFATDAEQYTALINGLGDGDSTLDQARNPLPLLSQPVSYAVAGSKDDGRSLHARISVLMDAVGISQRDLH